MEYRLKATLLIVGLIFLLSILKSMRERRFNPSHSVLWILITLFLVSVPVFESFYKWLSCSVIGMADARHIIYIALIGFLLVYVFYLTLKTSEMADKIQELISHIAILESKIKKT